MSEISINAIVLDPRTQMRVEPPQKEYLATLAEAYKADPKSVPVVRLFSDNGSYYCGDGHQRIAGARLAGATVIPAVVKDGGLKAAINCALGANEDNGERRTNATRRNCVVLALRDPEHMEKTDNAVAELCRVSKYLVAEVRKAMPKNGQSTAERAGKKRRVGRDGKTYGPSDANEDPAAAVCKRCQRVGSVKGCPACLKLKEAMAHRAERRKTRASKKSGSGKVYYDWRVAEKSLGMMYREPDRIAKAYKDHPTWPEVQKLVVGWKRLVDEGSNARAEVKKALLKLKD